MEKTSAGEKYDSLLKEKLDSHIAVLLRGLLKCSPKTGKKASYKMLAEHLGVKPQSISSWANGITTPDTKHIAPIAEYFGITTDYLLGKDAQATHEATDIYSKTGLSIEAQTVLAGIVGRSTEKSPENPTTQVLNALICDAAFWSFLDLIDYYAYCKANPVENNSEKHKGKIMAANRHFPELKDVVSEPSRIIALRRSLALECIGQIVDRVAESLKNKEAGNGEHNQA